MYPTSTPATDAMGNMTCRNVDTTSAHSCDSTQTGATMTYDNKGQLQSWTAPSGTNTTDQFLYDGSGSRVLQRAADTSGTTDTITFDGYTEVTIHNSTTSTIKYDSAAGKNVAMNKDGTFSYLLNDFLNSSSVTLNGNGTTHSVQLFAPYGSTRYSDGTSPTTYNFTGQRLDSITGLLYYNARYYDAFSGRFTSSDSVQGNAQGMDSYAYVAGNPETATDPTGQRIDFGGGETATINPVSHDTTFFTPSNNGCRPTIDAYTPWQMTHPNPMWYITKSEWHARPAWTYKTIYVSQNDEKPSTKPVPVMGGVLAPNLIKLAEKLMQNNKRLRTDFDSANWTVDHVVDGNNVTNDISNRVFTKRWYFYMNDGTGSKVAMSLNFNPDPKATDPWDVQHLKFSSGQPDPEKWGENGWMRNVDWADPGASENPGTETEQSFFSQYFSDTTPLERAIDEGEGGE